MPLLTLGLSHKSAPLAVRERLVFDDEQLVPSLARLLQRGGIREAAVISTCNRTEVYTVVDSAERENAVLAWLAESHNIDPAWLRPYLYAYHNSEAVRHLLRVAPGLDSLVLGESQIGGQAKAAYQEALNAGALGQILDRLFQYAFAVAKQIRTETGIGANPVSVAFAAVTLARQIFGDLNGYRGLLVGAGETIELTARHLREHGMRDFTVANRSRERARELADRYQGTAIDLAGLPEHLVTADVVVTSTGSQLPLLGKGTVERALRKRKHRPVFMVDIAVPRDIEPEVGQLDDVYLYTVDDLQQVIEDNMRSRRQAAEQAEEIITLEAERFQSWLRSLDSVPMIRAYRGRGEQQRDEVLERARRRLRRGDDPDTVLQYLAHTLSNRLMHEPTARLREAGQAGRGDLLEAARFLLGLDEGDS